MIHEALEGICKEHSQFKLEISDLGVFNGRDAIRVLWLGLSGDLPKLHALSAETDKSLVQLGFEPEKRNYTPHITIGQEIVFKSPFDQIRENIRYEGSSSANVKAIALYKSEQLQGKRVYTKLSEYPFLKE